MFVRDRSRRWTLGLVAMAALACMSCQNGPSAGLGLSRFSLSPGDPPAVTPVTTAAIVRPAEAALPSGAADGASSAALPTVTPAAAVSSGRGGGSRRRSATPEPVLPAVILPPTSFTGTIGNPADPLKIDGVRFDPDFASNGKLHLAFSVIGAAGQDLSAQLDPARTRAVMSFALTVPTPAPTPSLAPAASTAPTASAPAPYRLLAQPSPSPSPTAQPTPTPSPTPYAGVSNLEVVIESTKGQGRPPLDVLLSIDSTGSMQSTDPSRLRVGAGQKFIDQMRPSDTVAVMDFADGLVGGLVDPLANFLDARLLHAFSKDYAVARQAVEQVGADGSTNLYDAIAMGTQYLAAQNGNRPHALVVLTDGQDNSSVATIQDAITACKDEDILLMMLAFADFDSPAMHGVVSGTGGWFVGAEDPSLLEAQFGSAIRTVNGNAQAIIYVPADQRIAGHMAGRITTTIAGQDYTGSFNLVPPSP